MQSKIIGFAVVSISTLVCCGFDGCGNATNPNQGFTIKGVESIRPAYNQPGVISPRPGLIVGGNLQSITQHTTGSVTSYDGHTDMLGIYYVSDARTDAYWSHFANFGMEYCGPYLHDPSLGPGGYSTGDQPVYMNNLDVFTWDCQNLTTDALPGSSAHFADQQSLPSTLELSSRATPLSSSNGMPILTVYGISSENNTFPQNITANGISPDQKTASFAFPSTLPAGMFGLALSNVDRDGNLAFADFNYLSVGERQSFSAPFGVGVQVHNYLFQSTDTQDDYGDGTCVGQSTFYQSASNAVYPVATLFNSNSVDAGTGSTIQVGSQPAAILVYNQVTTNDHQQNGPCSSSDSFDTYYPNAVVANSGTNTLSFLDLGAGSVTRTVTVGANPVAMVFSGDGSYIFSANIGDSTISRVNLSTWQVSSLFVGGSPNTLEVTPDGSLWVGSATTLSMVNPDTLQINGSYPTGGQAIIAMKYNAVSAELVATTASSEGSVSVQEIDPAATANSNGVHTNAIRQVSRISTQNGRFHAYSQTAASSAAPMQIAAGAFSGISAQDSWLTVSATPEGFVVTDTVNHVELMRGATPGPVTSIAIDPSESTAYLAIPDANTVMSIPLP